MFNTLLLWGVLLVLIYLTIFKIVPLIFKALKSKNFWNAVFMIIANIAAIITIIGFIKK